MLARLTLLDTCLPQKLPHPRDTKASMGKDARHRPAKSVEKDPNDLFKMSKFRNVGSILCTQPTAARDFNEDN